MKITSETLPECQVKLQIEVDEERHAQAMEQAYKKLAPRVRIPGFRPGKAPRKMIERQIGEHLLQDEAADILLPEIYREAIEEQNLTPVAQPTVELVSHEPLVFSATVPLKPEIDLGDYHALRLEREPATYDEQQYEDTMLDLRRRYGTMEPVDRATQPGDIISGNVSAEVEGQVLFTQDDIEYRLTEATLESLPGLFESAQGLKKGDDVEPEYNVPLESPDVRMAGKTLKFHLVVHEVKEEKLADEDDAFAKQVGEGFETIDALRERIRSDLQEAADNTKLREYENDALDALLGQATIEFPQVLVDHEIEHVLEEQANLDPRDERAQTLYLQRLGKTEEEVKESVREEATQRLKRSLVLSQFADAENISVEETEIDEELQRLVLSAGEQGMTLMQLFNTPNGRETIQRSLLTRKTLARLVAIASGQGEAEATTTEPATETAAEAEGATEAAEPAAEPEKPKARRTAPRRAE